MELVGREVVAWRRVGTTVDFGSGDDGRRNVGAGVKHGKSDEGLGGRVVDSHQVEAD